MQVPSSTNCKTPHDQNENESIESRLVKPRERDNVSKNDNETQGGEKTSTTKQGQIDEAKRIGYSKAKSKLTVELKANKTRRLHSTNIMERPCPPYCVHMQGNKKKLHCSLCSRIKFDSGFLIFYRVANTTDTANTTLRPNQPTCTPFPDTTTPPRPPRRTTARPIRSVWFSLRQVLSKARATWSTQLDRQKRCKMGPNHQPPAREGRLREDFLINAWSREGEFVQ